MADEPQPWTLRLPPELKRRLKELAEKNQRSLNGEVVWALTRYAEEATGYHQIGSVPTEDPLRERLLSNPSWGPEFPVKG